MYEYTESRKAVKLKADMHKIITHCCQLLEIEQNKREKKEFRKCQEGKRKS